MGGGGAFFFFRPKVKVPLSTDVLFALLGVGGFSEDVSDVEDVEVYLREAEEVGYERLTSDSVAEYAPPDWPPSAEDTDLTRLSSVGEEEDVFFFVPEDSGDPLALFLILLSTDLRRIVSILPHLFFRPLGPATLSRILFL